MLIGLHEYGDSAATLTTRRPAHMPPYPPATSFAELPSAGSTINSILILHRIHHSLTALSRSAKFPHGSPGFWTQNFLGETQATSQHHSLLTANSFQRDSGVHYTAVGINVAPQAAISRGFFTMPFNASAPSGVSTPLSTGNCLLICANKKLDCLLRRSALTTAAGDGSCIWGHPTAAPFVPHHPQSRARPPSSHPHIVLGATCRDARRRAAMQFPLNCWSWARPLRPEGTLCHHQSRAPKSSDSSL